MAKEDLTQEELKKDAPRRGYITLGINTGEDNVRYCYALACSILNCDPNASITLVVDKGQSGTVPSYYEHVFDYMIELPYGNSTPPMIDSSIVKCNLIHIWNVMSHISCVSM